MANRPCYVPNRSSVSEMEQARKAGGGGRAFTTAVVLALVACAALFVWRFIL